MIYFIRAKHSRNIKIGYTSANPYARMAALQTGSHEPLEMIGYCEGSLVDERKAHERFKESRLSGEWFQTSHYLEWWVKGMVADELGRFFLSGSWQAWLIKGDLIAFDGPEKHDNLPGTLTLFAFGVEALPPIEHAMNTVCGGRVSFYSFDSIARVCDDRSLWGVDEDTVLHAIKTWHENDWGSGGFALLHGIVGRLVAYKDPTRERQPAKPAPRELLLYDA